MGFHIFALSLSLSLVLYPSSLCFAPSLYLNQQLAKSSNLGLQFLPFKLLCSALVAILIPSTSILWLSLNLCFSQELPTHIKLYIYSLDSRLQISALVGAFFPSLPSVSFASSSHLQAQRSRALNPTDTVCSGGSGFLSILSFCSRQSLRSQPPFIPLLSLLW